MAKEIGTFYEFFAGGGMARSGLAGHWRCLFANDFDHKKSATYQKNWGSEEIRTCDIRDITLQDLPEKCDLAWASFPCQDLSLAGGGAGLKGERSGTFWPFWDLIKELSKEDRAPGIIVLENVCGALSSHDGKDFATICSALQRASYRLGAVVVNATLFVPQSRPRLFIIGIQEELEIPEGIIGESPNSTWHTRTLKTAQGKLDSEVKKDWLWWDFPRPRSRRKDLLDIIEENPSDVSWHSPAETRRLLSMMSDVNAAKVEEAKQSGERIVGTIYKRTRRDEAGLKVQRAEVRFDNIAGCLRTPAGGSSRQLILVVEGGRVRSRLISSRETARLMGLPDHYKLPENYNEAYHLTGDGVVVPVVRYLAKHILEPIQKHQTKKSRVAA